MYVAESTTSPVSCIQVWGKVGERIWEVSRGEGWGYFLVWGSKF